MLGWHSSGLACQEDSSCPTGTDVKVWQSRARAGLTRWKRKQAVKFSSQPAPQRRRLSSEKSWHAKCFGHARQQPDTRSLCAAQKAADKTVALPLGLRLKSSLLSAAPFPHPSPIPDPQRLGSQTHPPTPKAFEHFRDEKQRDNQGPSSHEPSRSSQTQRVLIDPHFLPVFFS